MPDLTVGEIKRLLQGHCPGLIHELVPGCRKEGTVFSAPNPTRLNDRPGSFKIWPNGAWREYDEGEDVGKGDLINLIAYVHGYPPKAQDGRRFAIDWAKKRLGLASGSATADRRLTDKLRRQASQEAVKRDQEEARRAFRLKLRAQSIIRAAEVFEPSADNAVTAYLAARGIDLEAIFDLTPRILRFHPRLAHWTAGNPLFPAMVAAVIDPTAGVTGCHCTFLAPEGRPGKADVTPAKLMLGTVKGSIVPLTLGPGRLSLREATERGASCPVVLTEGIETGLSVAMATEGAARVWACLSLGHMAFAPIDFDCISAVVIAVENDTKAEAVRQREGVLDSLEARCAGSGKPVSTMRPHIGVDFNDTLRA